MIVGRWTMPGGKYGVYDTEVDNEAKIDYAFLVGRKRLFILITAVALAVMSLIYLSYGPIDISFTDVLKYIITFDRTGEGRIVWNIRLVRFAGALLVGAGLAVSGVVMQCILRNPLASPYTLGLSNASAFGAAFAIVFCGSGSMATSAVSINNPFLTTVLAFVFSMVATGTILLLTKVTKATAETMILAGIAISAIFSAALSLTQYVATDAQLGNIVSWMFGDVGRATWSWDMFALAVLLPVALYFIFKRWDYNAIDAGEEAAKGLGVNTEKERIIGMVLSSVLCSVLVSFFGIIAFIGLLGPHIARLCIGGDHRYLIPASMLVGALVIVISDLAGMAVLNPMVLPVGIITSILGGPLFIYLLIRRWRA